VTEGYELPPEADANLFEIGDDVLAKLGVGQLPQSLADALKVMETIRAGARSPRRAHLRVVPAQQAHEWRRYKTHVSRSSSTAT
jgi:glutamine synthetase